MMAEGKNDLGKLVVKLQELRATQPTVAFAKVVGIAPQTLQRVLTSLESGSTDWFSGKSTPKAKAGLGESLGRLVAYANRDVPTENTIDWHSVVTALGCNPQDSNMLQGLKRSNNSVTAADAFMTQDDPTLERIFKGSLDRKAKTPVAGVLIWPPYCQSSDEAELNRSFAGGLVRRLLGSLNPLGWNKPELKSMDFADVLTPDALRDGEIDVLMSLYDTAARRLAGFDFIHIPGIRAPLGGLMFGTEAITWANVLDPLVYSDVPDFEVYVVRNDAGDQLITGSCGYPDGWVTRLPEDGSDPTPDSIALALSALLRARAKGEALKNKPFTFVADASLVDSVKLKIDEILYGLNDKELEPSDLIKHFDPQDSDVPAYAIGLAVASNSPRWFKIVQDALVGELFGNMIGVTANSYVKLLSAPSTIKLSSLTPDLPEHVADDFAARVLAGLNEMANARNDLATFIQGRIAELQSVNKNLLSIKPQN